MRQGIGRDAGVQLIDPIEHRPSRVAGTQQHLRHGDMRGPVTGQHRAGRQDQQHEQTEQQPEAKPDRTGSRRRIEMA